jgi:transposase-like protein
MSVAMDEEIKRWTARRKSALVLEIIQGKTTLAEASRQFDLTPAGPPPSGGKEVSPLMLGSHR